jgi:hypothetical protein
VVLADNKLDSDVVAITPLTLEVSIPELVEKERLLSEIIVLVPIDPPKLEVSVLAEDERVLLVFKLTIDRLVPVALEKRRLVKLDVIALKRLANRFVVVALEIDAVFIVAIPIVAVASEPAEPDWSDAHSKR